MPEQLLAAIALPYATALLLSFLLEAMLHPRPVFVLKRPLPAVALHKGVVTILFALELLLFWRPWFATANVFALLLFMILVNNAKFQALREPFIFQDFEYFRDALKHPRLYLPFLGIWRAILAAVVILGALTSGMLLESPLLLRTVVTASGVLLLLGGGCLWLGSWYGINVSCEPVGDTTRLGQLACLWLYGRAERSCRPAVLPSCAAFQTSISTTNNRQLPDLIAVQSESFFDPRRSFPGISNNVLEQFDLLKGSSMAHGSLRIPAWGANTVRTEYAFLSGVDPAKLGIHRFNPYRWVARQEIATLSSFLQLCGYQTVCVHPYPANFYCRDTVYPGMGFEEFIDIQAFLPTDLAGPYVGDCAVAAKVHDLLAEDGRRVHNRPLFIYVITMENHGPLHLEKISPEEAALLYKTPPPSSCDDLSIYLRHLRNADRMIGMLRKTLENSERTGLLCFFGDHLPIMEGVYKKLGYPDGNSEYLIWSNRGESGTTRPLDVDVWNLAEMLVTEAGLQ